jgi:hypothetical protein
MSCRSSEHQRGKTVIAVLTVVITFGAAAFMGVGSSETAHIKTHDGVPITATDDRIGRSNNSPSFLADPTEPRFLALANRLDAPDFGCALHVSGDRGMSWRSVNPVLQLPVGVEKCYAPDAGVGPGGVLYYLFVGLRGGGNHPSGVFLTTSTDYARTFSAPRQILGPNNFSVRLAIDTAVGRIGRIHLVWVHASADPPLGGFAAGPNPILTAHSDDGGTTFSKPLQVNDNSRQRSIAPVVVLGSSHVVEVGYYDLKNDARDYQGLEGPPWEETWSLVLARSDDGGQRFSAGVVVDDRIVPDSRVMLVFTMPPASLAVNHGMSCAAWTDSRYGDSDVMARCSRDGKTWGGLVRVNDDAVGNGRSQYLPRLAVTPSGRIDITFLDRRNDPQNAAYDVYFSFSKDRGKRFSRNYRVTREPSSAQVGQRYANVSAAGQVEFGSRLGLLAEGAMVLLAWPDTRNAGTQTSQEVYVGSVDLGHGSARRLGQRTLAALGAVGVPMVLVVAGRRRSRRACERRGIP